MSSKNFSYRYSKISFLLFGLAGMLLYSNNAFGQSPPLIFTSSGNFNVPDKVTAVQVQVWGAGGGGGFTGDSKGAAGGGGGAFILANSFPVTPGSTIPLSIGLGGSGQTIIGTPGGTGGSSIFGSLSANGGGGAIGRTPGSGGIAGSGIYFYSAGGTSISPPNSNNTGGSGGGAAGSSSGSGANGVYDIGGGAGGTGLNGAGSGGPGGTGNNPGANGFPGVQPGGGGGGEGRSSASGGSGGDGQIIVSWTCSNTLTSAVGTNNQTVCKGTGITDITYEIAGAYGADFSGLPAGVTGTYNLGDVTISGTPTTPGTYNYTITPTGSCTSATATGTITVTPDNTASVPSSTPTVCINTALTNITQTTTGATGIGSATGLPAGVTAVWASNTITISGTPTASGTFNYSIPLTGGCGTVNATGTITVTADKTVSAPSSSPTLCINTALTNITHTTTGATGIGAATGLPAGVTAVWASNAITISGTPTASGTFNYSIPLTGGCGSANATGTITVTPDNTVSVPSSSPTFCINTGLTDITHTTTGATGIGAATGLPAGVTAVWASNAITISGTPTASGIFNYSIPLTGGCGVVNATGTITVTPDNTASVPSSTPTVCINTALTNITQTTTGATGIGAATGLPAGVNAVWASNAITISGTPTASGIFNYSIPLTGGCGTVNATGTITVTPDNTVSAPSSTPTLCVNIPLTNITHSTTGATGISNAGVSGANGLPAGLSATWAGNVITISGTPTQAGTFNYSIPLTGGCGAINATGTITVTPNTSIDSESLSGQTICDGAGPFSSISVTASGTGTLSYQWYSNTTPINSGGTLISGATSTTFTPPSGTVGTTYYYVLVSSTAGCGPNLTSSVSGAFIVNPLTVITTQPDNTDYDQCFGDGFSPISVTATGTALTYQWFSNTANSNSGGTLISGASSTTFTPPSTPEGITYYYVEVTGTCGIETSDVSGKYEVFPPITQIILDPSPNPQIICLGDSFTQIDVTANGAGIVSYQWYSNSSASNSGGTLISGATSQTYSPLSGTVGTTYYYAVANSDCGTVPTAVSGAFTVNPLTSIDSESLTGATICEGNGPFSPISVSVSGSGTLNYQWYSNTTNSNSGGSVISGANSNSFTPPSNVVGPAPVYYYVEVSSTGGCGPSKTSTVSGAFIVNPNPTANAGAAVAAICQGATSAAMGGSIGGGATGGTWSGGAGTWTNATNPATATYTAGAAESGTITLTLTTSGGSCGTTTTTKTITVNPNPTANAGAAVAAICQGATSAAMGGSVGGGATGGTWSGGVGTWTNATNPSTATYTAGAAESGTITLTLTTSGGSCGTTTTTKTITVNQNPTVTAGAALAAICQGGTSAAMGGSIGGGATGGTWSGGVGTWTNATNPSTATYTAGAAESGTITLTLTTSGGSCGTTTTTKTITVNPNPTANAGAALAAICQGATSAAMGGSVGGGATGGTWSGGVGTWTNATNPATATYTAGAAESGTITLTLTTSGGSCGTTTTTKTITVNPNPTANAGAAVAAICQGGTSAAMGGSIGGGATGGTWSGGAGTWTNATNPATATYTAGAAESGTITLTLTTSGGSCGTTTTTKTITVNPNPTANAGAATAAICQGATSAAMGGSIGGGATGGTWSGGAGTWTNATNPSTATYTAGAAEFGTITLTLTTNGGSCGTTTRTKTITVNRNPTANAGAAVAAICQGATSSAMGGSIGGGATGGTWSGGAGTWTNATNPSTATYTAGAAESGTITLTLTTSGGSCGTTTATKTITVNRIPTVAAGPALAAICQGATSSAMGGSIGGGATGGTWSGGAGTWTNATDPATATYTAGAAESGTITLTLNTSGGSCGPTTATKTITVNPNPTGNAGAAVAAICQGATSAAMGGSIGGGATGGTWSGGVGTWTNATNPSTATYTAGAAESGTITLTLTTSGGSCGTTTATKTITVNRIPTVAAGPALAAICQGATSSAMGGSIGGGATGGTWSGGAGTWTNATDPATATYTAGAAESGTITLTLTTSGGSCGTTTTTKTITVNPATAINSESLAAQTICDGQNFTSISITATGTGTLTYQWYTNTTNNNSTGTSIGGATSSSYTPPSSPIGTKYYYVVVSSNCGPSITSTISGAFTVNPITAITSQPSTANQVECFGDGFISISVSADGANLTYQWYSNSSNSNSGGTPVTGANSATFTPPSSSEGTAYYYVIVTGSCGILTSDVSGLFTVNPPITAISQDPSTTPQIICFGDSFTSISVSAVGEGTVSYQWYSNSSASNSGGTIIPGAISSTYTPLSGTVGTTYYYAVANSDCGTVPTAVSGAFTVNPLTSIDSEDLTGATICEGNGPFLPISVNASGTGSLNYQWYSNTTNSNSGGSVIPGANTDSFTPPSNVVGPAPLYYYVEVSSTGGCGPDLTSTVSGAFIVTPNNTVTSASSTPVVCINTAIPDITHSTTGATGIGSPTGLPTGVAAAWAGNVITISGTPSQSGTFNYTIPLTGGCGAVIATGTITVNPVATVSAPSVVYPSVCISSPALSPFTQPTTGVTSIANDGVAGANGLPPGISATFNSSTGEIEFSGTATTTGLFSYSIPLTGNCINGLQATGTIDVTPDYVLTSVSSVSATTIGGTATITINGDPTIISNGTYEVEYQIAQGSGSFYPFGPVTVTVTNGKGSFSTIPINSVDDTYVVQILSIKKSTDVCTITLPVPPATYFGVCSAVFDSSSTFFVPANVYSITIEVYGAGGGGDNGGAGGGAYSIRENIPVTPGEPLSTIVGIGGPKNGNGGVTYVTRDSNIADQLGNSLVYANGGNSGSSGTGGTFDPRFSGANGSNASGNNGGDGGGPLGGSGGANGVNGNSPGGGGGRWSGTKGVGGDGLVVISYSCPDADDTDCIKIIDDGSKSGYTIVEYICDDTWTAPEGLAEFTVFVGSGGGGGGGGEGSGGGGSGSLIGQTFTTSNPYGFPAGTNFTIGVGQGGNGAIAIDLPGENGEASTFTGTVDGNAINISVPGGGGGGSSQQNPGGIGASGGGGGASPDPAKSEGYGGTPVSITYTGSNVTVYQGNAGGDGDYSEPQNSVAGGGGGGLIPWKPLPANDGQNGKAAGEGQGEGGRGGDGIVLTLGDSIRYYGAGGGGIGRFFNGTDKIGLGGSAGGVKIGGDGNLTVPNPIGYPGIDKTGSGGGAGYSGGGRGGNGVVYIVYYNVRILGVEYQSFTATYNQQNRSGKLNWTTAKEWENSHFEIERSVNDTRSWAKVGEVTGKGYSDVPVEYSFTDINLPASGGNIFYRLRQVDLDGDFSYSLTRAIQVEALDGSTSWIAYPNPSAMRSSITVDLLDRSGYGDESILIRISDTRGIFESYSVSGPEEVSAVVNSYLDQARPGLHILQLIWGNKSEQLKLIRK